MCSIAGYLGTDIEFGRRFVDRANQLMFHRGPNDGGVFIGPKIALGNRRLCILDLSSAGHQPIISPDGRWILVFNGEIYNHVELRSRHCKDWPFQGHCDTETLLALLSQFGPAILEQMVGMWAFALWDATEERLLLSRDRYGQKPLYWRRDAEGGLRFSSEIKPLLAENEKPACNPTAVAEFLAIGNYEHLPSETFFREIYSFPPGHWAWVVAGQKLRPHRYWRFPTVPIRERRPLDQMVVRRFRETFEQSVRCQLVADVRVGATLSGGLDSSSVVSVIAAADGRVPMPVFTAQAAGARQDESRYVVAMQEKWRRQLDVRWTPLKEMRLEEKLRDAVNIQEEPFGDPSIIAHGLLVDAAKAAKVPVILGGQGGDELLFGYPWMLSSLLASALRAGDSAWSREEMQRLGLPFQQASRILLAAYVPGLERVARQRSRSGRRHWLSRRLRDQAQAGPSMGSTSDIVSMQLEAVEQVAIPHLTHYDDRNGMARSIETRMPFLDHRLADVLAELQPSAFLSAGASKRILREACADLLPQAVLQRRDKLGFFTPLEVMMQRENDWVRSVLLDDYSSQLGFYDLGEVERCLGVCARTTQIEEVALRVWRCLVVRLWAEEFDVQPMTKV